MFAWPSHALAQKAILFGRVLDAKDEHPVVGARVEVRGLNLVAQSDSSGVFRIPGVPRGAQPVTVRAIGYDTVMAVVQFAAADSVEADFLLSALATTLTAVRVEAPAGERYASQLREFEERRATGLGHFLDRAFFEKNQGRQVGVLLVGQIPGIRTRGGAQGSLVSERSGRICVPQTIVNGIVRQNFDLGSLNTSDIIGFEYHTVSTTPMKYNVTGTGPNGAHCGTAIFWIK